MDNSMKQDRPRYASLTAGLLARKGEAVPVAAAFSPGAMAQHLPAKRLAQESRAHAEPSNDLSPDVPDMDEDAVSVTGSLIDRTAYIEEAMSMESERQEPQLETSFDLLGDESPDGVDEQTLGLDVLVDRAIESAKQKCQTSDADEIEETGLAVGRDADLAIAETKSSCSTKRSDFAASIRNSPMTDIAAGSALQLDPRRYIRLQVAAMKLDVSRQELMAAALDSFLDTLLEDVFAECSCMQKGLI